MFKEVNPNPYKGMLAIKLALLSLFLLLAGCGGGGGGGTATITLTSSTITASTTTLPKGTEVNLVFTGTLSSGSTLDLTSSATWQSLDTTRATVGNTAGNKGTVLSVATTLGDVIIRASINIGGVVYTRDITITVAGPALLTIAVNPPAISVAKGGQVQFAATGFYTDGTQLVLTDLATWTSSNANASVSDVAGSKGLATASNTAGDATMTAELSGIQGTATISVTTAILSAIEIAPAPLSIAKGTQHQLIATGSYDDGTKADVTELVAWLTSNGSNLAVSTTAGSRGLITAGDSAAGTITTITASLAPATDVTLLVAVTDAALESIEVQPATPSISLGTKQAFTAIGHFDEAGAKTVQDLTKQVSWSSTDTTGQATIIISTGLASAVSVGDSTISAEVTIVGITKSDSTTLTIKNNILNAIHVTPYNPTLAVGTKVNLTATGNYNDGDTQTLTSQLTWESTDNTILTVDSTGRVTAVTAGTARIFVRSGTVVGSVEITVTSATLVDLVITSTYPSMAPGTKQALTATAEFSDGSFQNVTDQVKWNSPTPSVALVSNELATSGKVTALTNGSSLIRADFKVNSVSDFHTFTLTVNNSTFDTLTITPTSPTIGVGARLALTAMGTFTSGPAQDLTDQVIWTSDDLPVASVSNAQGTQGLVVGASDGAAVITANFSGSLDTETVTVNSLAANLEMPASLTIVAAPNVIYAGGVDSTRLYINVLAVGSGSTVPDSTTVNLVIVSGAGALSSPSVTTTNGADSSVTLTSSMAGGLLVVEATESGTGIKNTVPVYVVDGTTNTFTNMLGLAATFSGNESGGNIQAGALFGLFATNLSNRTFSVDRFQFRYTPGSGGALLLDDPLASHLSDGSLTAGEQMGYAVQLESAILIGDFISEYTLSDTPTLVSFTAGAEFDLVP